MLICFSGNRAGLDDTTGTEIAAEGLRCAARAAENAGGNLALEVFPSNVDHPDDQADRTTWGVQVCDLAGSPNVKLL